VTEALPLLVSVPVDDQDVDSEPVAVTDADAPGESDPVMDGVAVPVVVALPVMEALPLLDEVPVAEAEPLGVGVADSDEVADVVPVLLPVALYVAVPLGDRVAVRDGDAVGSSPSHPASQRTARTRAPVYSPMKTFTTPVTFSHATPMEL